MSEITKILFAIDDGDSSQASRLLPLVYEELRRLAAQKFAQEKVGHTLQPTVLVHEAYLRLVDLETPQRWNGRGHFFGAAAEAMRRILIEHARKKKNLRSGGDRARVELSDGDAVGNGPDVDILALDEALTRLDAKWPEHAQLVKLRFFAGMTIAEAAAAIRISPATAERHWKFAKTWLFSQLDDG